MRGRRSNRDSFRDSGPKGHSENTFSTIGWDLLTTGYWRARRQQAAALRTADLKRRYLSVFRMQCDWWLSQQPAGQGNDRAAVQAVLQNPELGIPYLRGWTDSAREAFVKQHAERIERDRRAFKTAEDVEDLITLRIRALSRLRSGEGVNLDLVSSSEIRRNRAKNQSTS